MTGSRKVDRSRGKQAASPAGSGAAEVAEKAGARIYEERLANGLRVLIAERPTDPVVAVMTWYRVGARNESEREAGLSHFLEHMMFKGSARFPKGAVDLETTRLGGMNNAFTGYDHTAYWFELASDRWERALEIEADRMQQLALEPREFDAERAVVLEELAMGLDDPWRNLKDMVAAAVFERHPYRRPIIGYGDALRGLDVDAMRDYYQRFYHPGNATLVVCGDVDRADVLRRVRRHFGKLRAGPAPSVADAFRPALEAPRGEKRVSMEWPDPGQRLCLAWPTAAFGSDEDYVLDVAATLLGSGRLSRLYRRLVLDEGVATAVGVDNDTRVEGGLFWIMAEASADGALARIERVIDEELERLANELVPKAELQRVKHVLIASEAYDTETATDLAEELGEYATDGDWHHAIDSSRRVRRVSAAAVRDCARRLLVRDRRVVGSCTPSAETPADELVADELVADDASALDLAVEDTAAASLPEGRERTV